MRIGLVVQFIAPNKRQWVASYDFAQLVRGEDLQDHFETLL